MFHYYLERENDKFLTFNIGHFPSFEIASPSNKRRTSQFQNLIRAGCAY